MHWVTRSVLDSARSLLPFQSTLRAVKQRIRPESPGRGSLDLLRVEGLEQIDLLRRRGIGIQGARVLEIGSGWCPVVPLLYLLAGARSVQLTDVHHLMDRHLLGVAVDYVLEEAPRIAPVLGCNAAGMAARLSIDGLDFPAALKRLSLNYTVPYQTSDSPAASIDLAYSRTVLEHVHPDLLRGMLRDLKRAIAPGGAQIHTIANGDHYAFNDSSLSQVNFLRFNEMQWRLLSIHPQSYHNRLRHSDYRHLMTELGYQIVFEEGRLDATARKIVETMPLAPRFRGYDKDDLATTSSVFILR